MDFEPERKTLNIGSGDSVVIDKVYGPTIFCGIRITADTEDCKWVIEREFIKQDKDGNDFTYWGLVCEFDAQESIDFD